ncbi:17639_t:CDS:2 [Funneliformis geosporum]|uniref:17639_t:CDS:1 n=1 Tax=Funneliformis geosporum TaxID=1117311 RepID=A0A9W4WR49_9GLOM|nr:17639_t:CDS:2 [Funneliformis geosporum]
MCGNEISKANWERIIGAYLTSTKQTVISTQLNIPSNTQDGASCHTSTYSIWWMRTHNIPILDWVAQSPDLYLIENLWNHLDSQVKKGSLPVYKSSGISSDYDDIGGSDAP